MKALFTLLFIISSLFSIAQEEDTLSSGVGVRLINSYQKEDIYSFLTLEMLFSKRLFMDVGFGYGWRRGAQKPLNGFAAQWGTHYNFFQKPKLFLGPSLRFYFSASGHGQHDFFTFWGTELGYHFSYGKKWKVVQAGYLGPHILQYRGNSGTQSKSVYLGYSLQLGLSYEI